MKTTLIKQTAILFLLFISSSLFAQNDSITISGHVKDEKGEDAIGAEVKVFNECDTIQPYATTLIDFNGNYTLTKICVGDIIWIKYLGFEPYKITIKEAKMPEIILIEIPPKYELQFMGPY